jgi:hypothetical protein
MKLINFKLLRVGGMDGGGGGWGACCLPSGDMNRKVMVLVA